MKGEMTIKATEHGFGIDMDLENISPVDKFELLHSVATGLQMDKVDMMMFCHLERMGVFTAAETVTHCEDDAQMERMLQSEGPGGVKRATAEDVLDELRKLMSKMEGMV